MLNLSNMKLPSKLKGKKRWILAAALGILAACWSLGVIDRETAAALGAFLSNLLGGP